jgi:hypothetical protein
MDHFVAYNSDQSAEYPTLYMLRKPLQKAVQQLYVLRSVADALQNEEYALAKKNIKRVYGDMQQFLLTEFREAFYRLNIPKIQELLGYVEQYDMQAKIVHFYIDQTLSDLKM